MMLFLVRPLRCVIVRMLNGYRICSNNSPFKKINLGGGIVNYKKSTVEI